MLPIPAGYHADKPHALTDFFIKSFEYLMRNPHVPQFVDYSYRGTKYSIGIHALYRIYRVATDSWSDDPKGDYVGPKVSGPEVKEGDHLYKMGNYKKRKYKQLLLPREPSRAARSRSNSSASVVLGARTRRQSFTGHGGPYTGGMVPSLSYGSSRLGGKPCLVIHREQVGLTSDPDVVYLGLGCNYERIWRDICKTIMAAILSERKIAVVNWDNACNINGIVELVYYQFPTSTAITTATALTFTNTSTPNTMATSLNAFFQTFLDGVHKIKEIRMTDTSNVGVTLPVQMSASNLKIHINCYQTLLVQNQTLGASADATAAASATAVASNPLYCGIFDSNSNIVYQKDRNNTNDVSWVPWVHWDDAFPEVIERVAAAQFTQIPNQVSNIFSNAKQTYKSLLQPGEMKKISLTHRFSGYLNSLIKQFQAIASVNNTNIMPMPGKQRIIAFDKMLDQESTPVNVAWELNQKIVSRYSYKKITSTVPQYE